MKKYFFSLFVILFLVNFAYGQNEPNYAAPGGGATCTCTAPSTSTCTADCLFSTCCVCWNPNTQTGACGCYYGIATCRTEMNSAASTMNTSNFGNLSPHVKIKFSFEKFNLLFDFFKSKSIGVNTFENSFGTIKSKYILTGKKIDISNTDFAQILTEYSRLIDLLDTKQKNDLNIFIKSIN